MSSIFESLKKVWEPTLRAAYKVDYKGILELDGDGTAATLYPMSGEDVDWDAPRRFTSVGQKARVDIIRATAGMSNSVPVVRLDVEDGVLERVGIPLWHTYEAMTLDKLEGAVGDLSAEAGIIWAAAELVDKTFMEVTKKAPCPMAGWSPGLQPLRKALRETMEDAEAKLPFQQLGQDYPWKLAVLANALLSVCQRQNQWSANVSVSQTFEATCRLRVLVVSRQAHLAEVEGDELRSAEIAGEMEFEQRMLAKASRIARNAEMTTALALS